MADGRIEAVVSANIEPFKKGLREARQLADVFYSEVSKKVGLDLDSSEFFRKIDSARKAVAALENELRDGAPLDLNTGMFQRKLKEARAAFEKIAVELDKPLVVGLNINDFQSRLDTLGRDVANLEARISKAVTVSIKVDTTDFASKLSALQFEISDFRRLMLAIDKVDVNVKPAEAKIKSLMMVVKRLQDDIRKAPAVGIKTEQFSKKLDTISKRVTALRENIKKSAAFSINDAEALNKLKKIKALVDGIRAGITKSFTVSLSAKNVKASLDRISERLKTFGDRNRTSIEVRIDLEKFNNQMQRVEKRAETFSNRVKKKLDVGGGGAAQDLTEAIRSVETTMKSLDKLVEPLKQIAAPLRSANQSFGNLSKQLDKVAKSGDTAALTLNKVGQSLLPINSALTAATEKIKRNETAVKAMAAAQRQAEKTIQSTGKAVEKSGTAISRGSRKVEGSTKSMEAFEKAVDGLADSAALVTGPLGGVASRIQVLGRAVSSGTVALVSLAAAVTSVGIALSASAREAEKFETSQLRINGIIKATGSAAGVTSKQLVDFSNQLGRATLGDPLQIQQAGAQLLLFRGIAKEVFFDVLTVSQNLSDLGFGSVSENAKRLGKALQDPVKGMDSLRESGVRLNPEILEAAKGLFKLGQRAQAQRLIMDELKAGVEGVSEEMGKGLAGAVDGVGQSFSEFLQVVAEKSGALEVAIDFAKGLDTAIQNLNTSLRENLSDSDGDTLRVLRRRREALREEIELITDSFSKNRLIAGIQAKFLDLNIRNLKILDSRIAKLSKSVAIEKKAASDGIKLAEQKAKAEQDRLDREEKLNAARAKAEAEQNRLKSLRTVSLRSLREENEISSRLLVLENKKAMSIAEAADARELVTRKVRLGLTEVTKSTAVLEDELMVAQRRFQSEKSLGALRELNSAKAALASAETLQNLKMELELRKFLSFGIRKDDLDRTNREADEAALESLQVRIQAQSKLLQAANKSKEAQEAASLEAEVSIRLAERLVRYQEAQILLSDKDIEQHREKIRLQVMQEQRLASLTQATNELAEKQQEAQEAQLDFQRNMASAMTDLIFSGSDFKDVLAGIITNLSRAVVEAQALKAVQAFTGEGGPNIGRVLLSAASSVFGGAGGGEGGTIEGITGQPGGASISYVDGIQAHSGGMVGQMPATRKIPTPVAINAPRYHQGLRQNEVPAILERGEEVIPKDQVGRRPRGNTTINFNVSTPDADSFRRSQRQVSRQAKRAII